MTVTVTQVYHCDICSTMLDTLEKKVPYNSVPQIICAQGEHLTVRSPYGLTRTHDICPDCWVKFCDWWETQK